MKVVTYSHARNALKSILDRVVQDADVTIISRRDAEGDAVVMSLDNYNSIMETLHLTSNPLNAAALAKAIEQDKTGRHKITNCLPLTKRASHSLCTRRMGVLPILAFPG
jgi:antitoxin YefM